MLGVASGHGIRHSDGAVLRYRAPLSRRHVRTARFGARAETGSATCSSRNNSSPTTSRARRAPEPLGSARCARARTRVRAESARTRARDSLARSPSLCLFSLPHSLSRVRSRSFNALSHVRPPDRQTDRSIAGSLFWQRGARLFLYGE